MKKEKMKIYNYKDEDEIEVVLRKVSRSIYPNIQNLTLLIQKIKEEEQELLNRELANSKNNKTNKLESFIQTIQTFITELNPIIKYSSLSFVALLIIIPVIFSSLQNTTRMIKNSNKIFVNIDTEEIATESQNLELKTLDQIEISKDIYEI